MSPRLLDLFCGAGGAGVGYARAGFDVVGVDIRPQPHYPFEFHQWDALDLMRRAVVPGSSQLRGRSMRFDAIHASPPCQVFSPATRLKGRAHLDLLTPIRDLLVAAAVPYVIENVEAARAWMRDPTLLCGAAFPELTVYRHRLFETNFPLPLFMHPGHGVKLTKLGHPAVDGEFMHVVGHFSGVAKGRAAMGIDWYMTQKETREAIPPAYTAWIGQHLIREIAERAA